MEFGKRYGDERQAGGGCLYDRGHELATLAVNVGAMSAHSNAPAPFRNTIVSKSGCSVICDA